MLHTPESFAPAHATPAIVPGTALAFAFAGSKLLIGGDEQTPAIPLAGELARAGIDGVRHYLGRLGSVDCIAMLLPDDSTTPPSLGVK